MPNSYLPGGTPLWDGVVYCGCDCGCVQAPVLVDELPQSRIEDEQHGLFSRQYTLCSSYYTVRSPVHCDSSPLIRMRHCELFKHETSVNLRYFQGLVWTTMEDKTLLE